MDPTNSDIPEVVLFLPHKKEANFFKMKSKIKSQWLGYATGVEGLQSKISYESQTQQKCI